MDDDNEARTIGEAFRRHYSKYYPSYANLPVKVERVTVEEV